MKQRIRDIFILNVIFIVLLSVCHGAFDKDKPAATTSLRNSNPEILANWAALETAIGQDHEFSTGGTNSGKHEVLTMEEETSAGASSTNEGHFQIIDGGTQPELAFTSEDGDELQFTKDGDLFSSDGLVVTENATFNGGITLGAGDDLIGSSTSDITFNADKFTVAGDTGNTLVAGTLSVTGVATLGDESVLATSAAPTTDAMIANKKYVDDNIAFSAYTNEDSESNTILKSHAYLAATDGWVSAIVLSGTQGNGLVGYVGNTNDPEGAGDLIQGITVPANTTFAVSINFAVAEGEFFEVTSSDTITDIWWKSIGALSKPVDQD